jgi:HD-GYP domain-containing protein (c-di-GMP phosphodiesterase class II)
MAEELVRDTRARWERGLGARARRLFAASGFGVGAGVGAAAIVIHDGPAFSPARFAVFVALYALVSRVEFEVGTGYAVPTQLVFVPMLFALPLGLVPLAVTAGLLLGAAADRPLPYRDPAKLLPRVANAAHSLGPVLVLAIAHGLPLRWEAWPTYAAALAAQFAFDLAAAVIGSFANGISPRTVVGFVWVAYAVDASLAPIALALAFETSGRYTLVALVLPLVALLRYFGQERQRRIDQTLELSDAYRGTAFLLGDVVEADDAYTGSHSRHVVDLVLGVADQLGFPPADRRDAEFVALLHDVGKIRVPSEIINKPGPLTTAERTVIEQHTIEGEQMLSRVGGLLGQVGHIVRSCHERWDGNGYPDRLAGEAIPLIARVVCACDAFSAMTTDRPYRAARTQAEALAELQRCAGTQFDPHVVAAIVAVSASV